MNLSPLPIQKFFDNAGNPLNGGLLFTYVAGTTTKIATYQDQAGTPNTNPVVLNFRGEANVWLDQALTYKFVLAPSTDTDPPTNPIWSVDNITAALTIASLTQQIIGQVLYPRSSAETLAGVNPVNFWCIYGNVIRYGTNTTPGTTDLTTAINDGLLAATATGGTGTLYHPGGQIAHASTIVVPNGVTIYGDDRNACEFVYSGTGSGWQNINPVNSSGYGKVRFQGLKLSATNASNAGAAIEFNTGGYSYYQVIDCWLFNKWKFGLILDGVEVGAFNRNIIDLAGTQVGQIGIWIVNGPDRHASQSIGFTNVISIRDNQISGNGTGIAGSCIGIADDGGNGHLIEGNNLNNHSVPLRIAGCNSFTLICNSLETHAATGGATAQFTTLTLSGVNVGQNTNGVIHSNGFFADLVATSNNLIFISQSYTVTNITQAASAVVTVSTVSSANPFANMVSLGVPITFQGVVGMSQINGLSGFVTAVGGSSGAWTATVAINSTAFTAYSSGGTITHYHAGLSVTGNVFGFTVGRGSAIDVTQLANSFCGNNFDLAQSAGMGHYTGVHNDSLGNTLLPPQNGSVVSLGISGPTYGDSRFPWIYSSAIVHKRQVTTYSAAMALDLRSGDAFYITATNGTAFTITYSNALDMNRFSVTIINTSGGALGAATWTGFKLGAAWVQPANGFRRTIEFEVDGAGIAHEINRSAADVTN